MIGGHKLWRKLHRLVVYTVIALALLVVTFPIYWLFITSFKPRGAAAEYPPKFVPVMTLRNYQEVLVGTPELPSALLGLKDSLIIALGNTLLSVSVGFLAAYSIVRFKTGGKNFAFWLLSNRFLPPVVFVVPLFLLFRSLRLFDTHISLVLVYCTFNVPLAVWLLMAFIQTIPQDLEEAAMVDGCTRFSAFLRVTIPLAAPGVVTTLLFCFLFAWNEYTLAFMLTGEKVNTLTVLIPRYQGGHDILYEAIAAASILSVIPGVLFAYFLQRYLARGLMLGALK